jgi:O-antigen/teichoic acid export membrane protein
MAGIAVRPGAGEGVEAAARREGRLPDAVVAVGLRRHAARGTIVNAVFQIGLAGLLLVRRLVVAAFLTPAQFGVWGALLAALLLIVFIKNVGVSDKFVQQSEADQELAFQKMLTIDLALAVAAVVLAAVALPFFALAYGNASIILPGLLLSTAIIANSLQAPVYIFYRRMDFVRQRALQAVDPCSALIVTIGLAALGGGYWALVVGAVAGSLFGAGAALIACPYPVKLRLDRGTVRDYYSFSWPLAVASGGRLAVGNGIMLIAARTMGLAQTGAIGMANSITGFSDGVDGIVTQTLYPAICAVRDRAALLHEVFVKSNRIALMWGMPFGLGVTLFASDIVYFGLGARWAPAIPVLQAFGVVAASDQLGFNWSAFLRALNMTRPLATMAAINVAAFVVLVVPLMIAFGLRGFAVGWLIAQVVNLTARSHYLSRLFTGFSMLRHAGRAAAPMIPAVGVVLLARAGASGDRGAAQAVTELVLFVVVSVAATAISERALLREVLGYLRRAR